MVNGLIEKANQTGSANLTYIRVRLEQDSMLVSAKGEALGFQAETAEDMEVRFEGRTVFASGKVNIYGFAPMLVTEIELNCQTGKPAVDVKTFELGNVLPLLKMMGIPISKEKIAGMINSTLESSGLIFICNLESIRIEDGKLILTYK